jgi:hypothetical protein
MEHSDYPPGVAQFLADNGTYWIRHPNRWQGVDVTEIVEWGVESSPFTLRLGRGTRSVTLLQPSYLVTLEQVGSPVWEKLDGFLSERVIGYRFSPETQRIADYREPYLAEKERLAKAAMWQPWVVRADIRRFFRSVPLSRMTEELSSVIGRGSALVAHLDEATRNGLTHLPPGSSTARVLANWWLAPVDRGLDRDLPTNVWSRWLDDYTILASTREEAKRCLEVLETHLSKRGLNLSPAKTRILRADSKLGPLGDPELDSMGDVEIFDEDFAARLTIKLHQLNFHGFTWRSALRFCLGRLRAMSSDCAVDWIEARRDELRSEWRAVARYLAVLSQTDRSREVSRLLTSSARPTDGHWISLLSCAAMACYTESVDVRDWVDARVQHFGSSLVGQHAAVALSWRNPARRKGPEPTDSQWGRLFHESEPGETSTTPMAI